MIPSVARSYKNSINKQENNRDRILKARIIFILLNFKKPAFGDIYIKQSSDTVKVNKKFAIDSLLKFTRIAIDSIKSDNKVLL